MNYGIIGTYRGDTFKNLVRMYSNQRMSRDRRYRERVLELIELRRDTEKKDQEIKGELATK